MIVAVAKDSVPSSIRNDFPEFPSRNLEKNEVEGWLEKAVYPKLEDGLHSQTIQFATAGPTSKSILFS